MGFKPSEEWLVQADYDMDTADFMMGVGRYIYTIFMIHLSIEKALKANWAKKFQEDAPKTHHLEYLLQKLNLNPTDEILDTILEIDQVSVPTRYPEELKTILSDYTKDRTEIILIKSKKVLEWLKTLS